MSDERVTWSWLLAAAEVRSSSWCKHNRHVGKIYEWAAWTIFDMEKEITSLREQIARLEKTDAGPRGSQ